MTDALKHHWLEYLMEATCLGLFMVSAFTFGTVLEHPASVVHQALPHPLLRRFLMGLAMGSTAIAIIYSPWGKQSGAHINPSTTLTFFRLGKVATWDSVFYVTSQFVGGIAGAFLASTILAAWVSHPSVHYVVTMPGDAGVAVAFVAEVDLERLETLAAYRGKVRDFEKGKRCVHGGRLSPKVPKNAVVSFAVLESALAYICCMAQSVSRSRSRYSAMHAASIGHAAKKSRLSNGARYC